MHRLIILFLLLFSATLPAKENSFFINKFNQEQQDNYKYLINSLRCMVCQNQTIADSNSQFAEDLRYEIAKQIIVGKSNNEIIEFFVKRYGEEINFSPLLNANTLILWFAPILFLVLAFVFFLTHKNILRVKK